MSNNSNTTLYSVEAERAVLGGLLLDSRYLEFVVSKLHDDFFYVRQHKLIFAAIVKLSYEGKNIDVVTVSEKLKEEKGDGSLAFVTYLWKLVKETPGTLNIAVYTNIVYEKHLLRSLADVGTFIIKSVYSNNGKSLVRLFEDVETRVFATTFKIDFFRKKTPTTVAKILGNAVEKIENFFSTGCTTTGLSFGFPTIDKLTTGLHKADLIVVAGRPTMGKTTFAMNVVENVLTYTKCPVVFFSLEMSAEQLALRLLSSLSDISLQNLRVGKLTTTEWTVVRKYMSEISKKNLYIDDRGSLGLNEIKLKIRRVVMEHGNVGLVVIDYLQLMKIKGTSFNRTTEISEISRSLKMLAREFDVPIIVLSQLNRGLEQRSDKRPLLCDLRDSGAIEQDADLILFIHREELYNTSKNTKGKAEIIIGKQRNGPIGSVSLFFSGQFSKFKEKQ